MYLFTSNSIYFLKYHLQWYGHIHKKFWSTLVSVLGKPIVIHSSLEHGKDLHNLVLTFLSISRNLRQSKKNYCQHEIIMMMSYGYEVNDHCIFFSAMVLN